MSIEAYDYGKKDGATEERERIIAVLKEADSACSPWAIALIKGENK